MKFIASEDSLVIDIGFNTDEIKLGKVDVTLLLLAIMKFVEKQERKERKHGQR